MVMYGFENGIKKKSSQAENQLKLKCDSWAESSRAKRERFSFFFEKWSR
jgi:hypothetical protein